MSMMAIPCKMLIFISALVANTIQAEMVKGNKIPAQLKQHGFNILLGNLNEIDLIPGLDSQGGPFTIFAPTDEAFKALGPELFPAFLLRSKDTKGRMLQNLIVREAIPESSIYSGLVLDTFLDGTTLTFNVSSDKVVTINSNRATIIGKIDAENGIIYMVDKFIIITLPQILRRLGSRNAANGTLTVFEKAIRVAGLTERLIDPEQFFTIFAPPDAAFNELGDDVVNDILSSSEKSKKFLLDQYIVPGLFFIEKLSELSHIDTFGGKSLVITKNRGGIQLGAGNVIVNDRFSYNGIIHVIDKVHPILINNKDMDN